MISYSLLTISKKKKKMQVLSYIKTSFLCIYFFFFFQITVKIILETFKCKVQQIQRKNVFFWTLNMHSLWFTVPTVTQSNKNAPLCCTWVRTWIILTKVSFFHYTSRGVKIWHGMWKRIFDTASNKRPKCVNITSCGRTVSNGHCEKKKKKELSVKIKF